MTAWATRKREVAERTQAADRARQKTTVARRALMTRARVMRAALGRPAALAWSFAAGMVIGTARSAPPRKDSDTGSGSGSGTHPAPLSRLITAALWLGHRHLAAQRDAQSGVPANLMRQ
jgi:hypothetical protein